MNSILKKVRTRFYLTIQLLILVLCFGGAACRTMNFAAEHEISKNEARRADEANANSSAAEANGDTAIEENKKSGATLSIADIEGRYEFNNYRKGKGGNMNFLTIEKGSDAAKIRVYWEGTNLFMANGAETFHERTAAGELRLKGNTASGKLVEEDGGTGGCAVTLTFAAEKVSLKSSTCDINVSPDGVYKKTAKQADEDSESPAKSATPDSETRAAADSKNQSSKNDSKPFIQYDEAGAPTAIVNLMASAEERVGCEPEELTFAGKVSTLDNPDDFAYEFTLADGGGSSSRKRQKISLILAKSDKIPADDVREIIKVGANLTVKYINCGNAPIASPITIYRN
jgi:hypothetical protein